MQQRFPGFIMRRTEPADGHNGHLRFGWELGPADGPAPVAGIDIASLGPDGRLASIVGFIDRAPAAA